MNWLRSIRRGLACGREGLLAAGLFYSEAFLLSSLALAPLSSGMHAALDGAPLAAEIGQGGGLDLLVELGIRQPGLWAAGFGGVPWALLAHLALALLLTAGAYGAVASRDQALGAWRRFGRGSVRNALPFGGLVALNAVAWGIAALVPVLVIGGAKKVFEESEAPWALWGTNVAMVLAVLAVWTLFKGSLGFGQARRVVAGPSENLGRCFLRATAFSLRRLPAVAGMTVLFGTARAALVFGVYGCLAPGYSSEGKAWATLLLLQLVFAGAAYLRVAEIGAQVAFLRAWGEAEAAGDKGPAADSSATVPSGELEGLRDLEGDAVGDVGAEGEPYDVNGWGVGQASDPESSPT